MKNITVYILGILSAIFLMIVLLISSVDILCYHIPGYFKYEFEKYKVYESVDMDINELLNVNSQMMDYLIDKRENLHDISAKIAGVDDTLFFNAKEAAHMKDVKNLFLSAILIRRLLCIFILFSITIIYFLKRNIYTILRILGKSILIGAGFFFVLVSIFACIISLNFTEAFYKFHEIFFSNDLWLLDANTDRLINIVPEPFFMDTARNISLIFFLLVLISFMAAIFMLNKAKDKK